MLVWIYTSILVILLTSIFYFCFKFLPWFYHVQVTIRNSHRPFLVVQPHWLFGHIFMHGYFTEQGLLDSIEWMKKSKNGIYAHFLPIGQSLVFSHPSSIQKILNSSEPKGLIPATGSSYKLMVPWIGDGLLTSSGGKWARNRRLLTPAFHFDILKPYMDIYNDCANALFIQIDGATIQRNPKTTSSCGESLEIFDLLNLFTLNVILRCAFSVDDNVQAMGDRIPYVRTVRDLGRSITERLFRPHWLVDGVYYCTSHGREFRRLCNYSHEYASKVISSRRARLKSESLSHSKRYRDFLDILLLASDPESGTGLTDREIRDEVETFLFEAHDTTSCALAWLLYNLARHPHIQAKVQSEVDEIFEGQVEESERVRWSDLNRMPYLTRCIKESLRTHPPVPAVNRELTRPLDIQGCTIPPGAIVQVHINNVHHNPEVWGDDYMQFDPDRFLPDRMAHMDPYAFIPFSAGPRNCIGQTFAMHEIKTTVARLLRRYHLRVDENHTVRIKADLILRAENGIKLHFIKRTDHN